MARKQKPEAVDLKTLVDSRTWWHTIDLGGGIITPGHETPDWQGWKNGCLPAPLDGKTVLDVGAWDGVYSLEALARGAKHVTALDANPKLLEGARMAAKALMISEYHLDFVVANIEERPVHPALTPGPPWAYDVVVFFGVLYHLEDPLGALRVLRGCAREVVCLESFIMDAKGQPFVRVFGKDGYNGDPTVSCQPSPEAIVAMADRAGFSRIEPVGIRGDRFMARLWV